MIDKSRALQDFGITVDILDEMLKEFVVQAEDNGRVIENLVGGGDFAAAARVAHSLKGVSGNMRLDNCYKTAVALETSVKAGDAFACASHLATLRADIEEIRKSV
jgi:HPt (histidine-containing phosphotransfer) domain-containing protein